MSEILDKYQLTFVNRKSGNLNIKDCTAPDSSDGTNIGMLLYLIKNTMLCEDIISEIDFALARSNYNGGYAMDGTTLEINTSNSVIDYNVEIPTKDLKEIILEWKQFLETPPINNQKMD